jgi:SAM-dependent methyltransferase
MSIPFALSPLEARYDEKYQDRPRMDLMGLLDFPFQTVLEVGCGSGATARAIKERVSSITYLGIEIDQQAADEARTGMDRVLTGDIEQMNLDHYGIRKNSIDLVIFADVLEHLYDPWKVLRMLHPYLRADGRIIASIPNIQNIGVVQHLIKGYWTYANMGLLDATHIRFFTLAEIGKLFAGSGYATEHMVSILNVELPREGSWPRDLDFGNVLLRSVTLDQAQQLFTFQYLIRASKNPANGNGGRL